MAPIVFGSPEARVILDKDRSLQHAEENVSERDRLIAEGRLYRVCTRESVHYIKVYEVEADSPAQAEKRYRSGDDVDDWEETDGYEGVDKVELITAQNKDKRR